MTVNPASPTALCPCLLALLQQRHNNSPTQLSPPDWQPTSWAARTGISAN